MARSRNKQSFFNIWPAFVDVLASVLMILIFLVMIFVISQIYLDGALQARDRALVLLENQLQEIGDELGLIKTKNANLNQKLQNIVALNATLNDKQLTLEEQLAQALLKEQSLIEQSKVQGKELSKLRLDYVQKQKDLHVGKEKIKLQIEQIVLLNQQIENLMALKIKLESTIASNDTIMSEFRDMNAQQRDKLIQAHAANQSLQHNIEQMRAQILQLTHLLDASEQKDLEQEVQIHKLGERLNTALARKVHELDQYRSEFFGKIRELLKGEPLVEIKGDRFIFQSEVLFDEGSDNLGNKGVRELAKIAVLLLKLSSTIPNEINWILRIDGHTDKRPIFTNKFPSNWELSSARATSVARYLITKGVPANRIAIAGFGEHQPLDIGDSEFAYTRNRRIEIKLTQK